MTPQPSCAAGSDLLRIDGAKVRPGPRDRITIRIRQIMQTEAARASTPYIDYKQFPDGIDPSEGIELSGAGKNLAIVLRSGPLPLRVVVAR